MTTRRSGVRLRTVGIAALTVGLVAFFLRNARLAAVWAEVAGARRELVLAALGVTTLTYAVRALRWQGLLAPVGRTRFSAALRATVIGFAVTFLLPARAGEVVRPYVLARREGLSATSAFATIVVERLLDLVTVALLFGLVVWLGDPGVAGASQPVLRAVEWGAAVAAVGGTALLVVLCGVLGHPERLGRLAGSVAHGLPGRVARPAARLVSTFAAGLAVLRQPGPFSWALALSVPLWLSIAYGIWLVTAAFRMPVPFSGAVLLLALLTVGVAVPTPGGIGGFHTAFQIGATALYGVPTDRAVGAALVLHAVSFVPVTAVGLVLMAHEGLHLLRVEDLRSHGAVEMGLGPTGRPVDPAGARSSSADEGGTT